MIEQTSNIYGGSGTALPTPGTYALMGENGWTNYTVAARMQSTDNDAVGLTFGYRDRNNYYRFSMDQQRGYRRLVKAVNGNFTLLAQDAFLYNQGQWYAVQATLANGQVRILFDGQPLFSVNDVSHAAGRIALYSWCNAGSRFDDVVVTAAGGAQPPLFTDTFSTAGPLPAAWTKVDQGTTDKPSNWSVANGALQQMSNIYGGTVGALPLPGTYVYAGQSTWSNYTVSVRMKSSDDDALGLMFGYKDANNYYRFSMDTSRNYRRLVKVVNGTWTQLAADAFAYAKDQWYAVAATMANGQIRITFDGQPLFTKTDSSHTSGRIALYTWCNAGSYFDDVVVTAAGSGGGGEIFRDEFTSGSMANWTVVDQGTTDKPSKWSVSNGMLHQTSNIYSGTGLPLPGTFAYAGQSAWTNYVFSAKMRSADNDAIGLMFGYKDANNYYRFSMDTSRNYRRLVKVVNGAWTKLAEDAFAYAQNQWYAVEATMANGQVRITFNGQPLFTVNDASHANGRIALYTWCNTGSDFDDVVVTAAP
ncbi:MAG: DUF1080 domain-containing protein [Bryobacteraceae bacterium]|nr:DUF1080 domain-containing protein [Bryobacteraceae bacterium]